MKFKVHFEVDIKNFLIIILTLQTLLVVLMYLDVKMPLLRQLVGFIYLTFIPGLLILKIFKIKELNFVEFLLYSVGLSIAFLMFSGFFVNMLGPIFGVSKPLSFQPIIVFISIFILCCLCYWRNKNLHVDSNFKEYEISPMVLFLFLIPFLTILGTYMVNLNHTNILLLFLIIIISFFPILICFYRIPVYLYPLAVFVVSLSLLWHRSLISMYITGWDFHLEYYFSELVRSNFYWNWTIKYTYNAMLSDTLLPAIYSSFLDINIAWLFKIIYPIFFSLVPVGLYIIYERQTASEKVAFLAVFFFMSLTSFYSVMVSIAKQQIAELFLVLLLLTILNKKIDSFYRSILTIAFSAALVVSHYGTSYIFMFCLFFSWISLALIKSKFLKGLWQRNPLVYHKIVESNSKNVAPVDVTIKTTYVFLFFVFILSWYMYLSQSVTFDVTIKIAKNIIYNLSEMFDPATKDVNVLKALGLQETLSPLHEVSKLIYQTTVLFIIVGVIDVILKYKKTRFEKEYMAMSIMNMGIIIMCIVLPYFADTLQMSRFYHLSLIFLSPFCILGGILVFKFSWTTLLFISSCIKERAFLEFGSIKNQISENKTYLALIFVIISYFLFNTGFIYEVSGDVSTSISLNMDLIENGSIEYTYAQDVFSAKWLSENRNSYCSVYCDRLSYWYILPSYGELFPANTSLNIPSNSLLYLSYINLRTKKFGIIDTNSENSIFNITEISPSLWKNNKIYSNGASEIYYYK